jgi:hypothetical protein
MTGGAGGDVDGVTTEYNNYYGGGGGGAGYYGGGGGGCGGNDGGTGAWGVGGGGGGGSNYVDTNVLSNTSSEGGIHDGYEKVEILYDYAGFSKITNGDWKSHPVKSYDGSTWNQNVLKKYNGTSWEWV